MIICLTAAYNAVRRIIYTSLFRHRDSENKPNNKTRMTRTTMQKIIVTVIIAMVRYHDYQFAEYTVNSGKAASKLLLSLSQ